MVRQRLIQQLLRSIPFLPVGRSCENSQHMPKGIDYNESLPAFGILRRLVTRLRGQTGRADGFTVQYRCGRSTAKPFLFSGECPVAVVNGSKNTLS